jgi:hypothetical protein
MVTLLVSRLIVQLNSTEVLIGVECTLGEWAFMYVSVCICNWVSQKKNQTCI